MFGLQARWLALFMIRSSAGCRSFPPVASFPYGSKQPNSKEAGSLVLWLFLQKANFWSSDTSWQGHKKVEEVDELNNQKKGRFQRNTPLRLLFGSWWKPLQLVVEGLVYLTRLVS